MWWGNQGILGVGNTVGTITTTEILTYHYHTYSKLSSAYSRSYCTVASTGASKKIMHNNTTTPL